MRIFQQLHRGRAPIITQIFASFAAFDVKENGTSLLAQSSVCTFSVFALVSEDSPLGLNYVLCRFLRQPQCHCQLHAFSACVCFHYVRVLCALTAHNNLIHLQLSEWAQLSALSTTIIYGMLLRIKPRYLNKQRAVDSLKLIWAGSWHLYFWMCKIL